jgi:hypothetical protein
MLEKGRAQDTNGHWLDPAHVEQARRAFATAA